MPSAVFLAIVSLYRSQIAKEERSSRPLRVLSTLDIAASS